MEDEGLQVIIRAAAWVVLGVLIAWVINALFPHKTRNEATHHENDSEDD